MSFYKTILKENLQGVSSFIEDLSFHEGFVHIEKLHIVEMHNGHPSIRKGKKSDKVNEYAIGTGGEVVNSYVTLYELGYFFICLFLAGVATAAIKKGFIETYKKTKKEALPKRIMSDLLHLTEKDILEGMKKPEIGIIGSLDTDITPLRYNKHQLWRLRQSALGKRVTGIVAQDYGVLPEPPLNKDYWTIQDQEIANLAMQSATTLPMAKIIQYYVVLQIFFRELGIDIQQVKIWFNFVPKEEIAANGPKNSFLKALIGLHTTKERINYRKITGIDNPWIITKACTKCGQGDKRILSSKLMKDGITVHAYCKPHKSTFKNERNDIVTAKGCGNKFSFTIPTSPRVLYKFLIREDIAIHFAARELLAILKDSIDTPIGLVLTDMGIIKGENGQLMKDPYHIQGYGDHLEMITSALTLAYLFIQERIAKKVAGQLKKEKLLMPRPLMLFGYDRPTQLVDPDITALNKAGKVVHVADTSALKVFMHGQSAKTLFKKALHIHSFSVEELCAIKGKPLHTIEQSLI